MTKRIPVPARSEITRIWHGRTRTDKADAYLEFLKQKALPDYHAVPGNTGARILRRIDGDTAHFWTVSTWESLECIKAFAGEAIEKAHYYPEDAGYLLEFEPHVMHCETYL